jgi:hypothetical protein
MECFKRNPAEWAKYYFPNCPLYPYQIRLIKDFFVAPRVCGVDLAAPGGDHTVTSKCFEDGEPCSHHGCLNHVSHPCEGCGRIKGQGIGFEILKTVYCQQSEKTKRWERIKVFFKEGRIIFPKSEDL